MINFYKNEKKDLAVNADNQIALSSKTSYPIAKVVSQISNRILALIKERYSTSHKNYHLDHGGLYCRIPGNFCPYHADNGYFHCPVHGNNQSVLRSVCDGSCIGAGFIANHTYWREFTALLYLNEDFEGGEILFEDGPCNRIYKKVIPIKANMLILAPNGEHFYHEVFPIKKGKRYSLHLWYTSDPQHKSTLVR